MCRKRKAELNHENCNEEDPSADHEEMGTFKAAPKEILQNRVIKTAKRRTLTPSDETKKGGVFSGFGGFNKAAPSSFDLTNGNKSNGSTVGTNDSTSASSVFGNKAIALSSPSTSAFATTFFSAKGDTKSESTSTTSSNTTNNGSTSFGTGKSFSLNTNNVKSNTEQPTEKNEEEKEPPKVEFTPVVEENCVFEKNKCKIYVAEDNNFVDKGFGTLYINQIEDSGEYQLLVRANTGLGNVLLNLTLSASIPMQRSGIFHVMMLCIPTPESKPPPTPVLITVDTSVEADALLETLNKYKNNVKQITKNNEEEPPTVELTPVVAENCVFEKKKCKIYLAEDNNFVDKGFGTLYINQIEDSGEYQLLVRANTGLGNVLLNLTLSASIPMQRSGIFYVMMLCIPTPESKPPPTPVLITVDTSVEADALLETLNKYKNNVKLITEKPTVNNEEEPPTVELTPVVAENCVFEKKKCKIYLAEDNNFVDKGFGTLYINKNEDSGEYQLLVRANTGLGNVLLNLTLSASIPMQRLGVFHVMMLCIPTPESKPPPTPVLITVQTSDEADALFETINKYKM